MAARTKAVFHIDGEWLSDEIEGIRLRRAAVLAQERVQALATSETRVERLQALETAANEEARKKSKPLNYKMTLAALHENRALEEGRLTEASTHSEVLDALLAKISGPLPKTESEFTQRWIATRVVGRVGGANARDSLLRQLRLVEASSSTGGRPEELKLLLSTAVAILGLEPMNMEASDCVMGKLADASAREPAVHAAVPLVEGSRMRTAAMERIRREIVELGASLSDREFGAAVSLLLRTRPASTCLRCVRLFEAGDKEIKWALQSRLGRVSWELRHTAERILMHWLEQERDSRLLISYGVEPLVPKERVQTIIVTALEHPSPYVRKCAAMRCIELDPHRALFELEKALEDEPDHVLTELMEHLTKQLRSAQ